jgi:hypothetical protein
MSSPESGTGDLYKVKNFEEAKQAIVTNAGNDALEETKYWFEGYKIVILWFCLLGIAIIYGIISRQAKRLLSEEGGLGKLIGASIFAIVVLGLIFIYMFYDLYRSNNNRTGKRITVFTLVTTMLVLTIIGLVSIIGLTEAGLELLLLYTNAIFGISLSLVILIVLVPTLGYLLSTNKVSPEE